MTPWLRVAMEYVSAVTMLRNFADDQEKVWSSLHPPQVTDAVVLGWILLWNTLDFVVGWVGATCYDIVWRNVITVSAVTMLRRGYSKLGTGVDRN